MEGGKRAGSSSSSSSFTTDLFGSKEPSASSSSVFGSIFSPNSPKVLGREPWKEGERKHDSATQALNAKPGPPEAIPQSKEGESPSTWKDTSSYYNEQNVQPCHLSSSIYYGGQDIYSTPHSSQSSGYTTHNKDGGEDDSGSASRGNWWQGGLYY